MTDPGLHILLTLLAQSGYKRSIEGAESTKAQNVIGQILSAFTSTRQEQTLVLQSDVRPVFRGAGSDKSTACEWKELMEVY